MDLIPRNFNFDELLESLIPNDNRINDIKCDIYEENGEYHLEMDIPGMKKENVKVECQDGYLSIIASGEKTNEEKDRKYVRRERYYGRYQRKFYVGDIDPKDIKAEFKDGSLFVTFPKENEDTNKYDVEVK